MSSGGVEPNADIDAELNYLRLRIYEEAEAAVAASSTDATLIHVILATAYAKRLAEQSRLPEYNPGQSWADHHRVW
jgi:hypothetical protein